MGWVWGGCVCGLDGGSEGPPGREEVEAHLFFKAEEEGAAHYHSLNEQTTHPIKPNARSGGLPVCIVRPSLVCGVAGAPYPGYSASLAGPGGLGLAQAVGFFDRLGSVAAAPTHVWDVVPGDQVAATVVAAAAATSARVMIDGYEPDSVALGSAVLGARGGGMGGGMGGGGMGGMGGGAGGGGSVPAAVRAGSVAGGASAAASVLGAVGAADGGPLIVHAATGTTYPISFVEAQWAALDFISLNPPPFRLPGAELFRVPLDYRPDAARVEAAKARTAWKVWFALKVLEALGQHRTARRLRLAHVAWAAHNSVGGGGGTRGLFFSTRNLLALEQQLEPAEAGDYALSWTLRHGGWPRYIATALAGALRF